jgi:DNA-binding transcriptional ArsR family regulator
MPKSLPTATLDLTGPVGCEPLSGSRMLGDASALELAVRLKALADPVRLKLVSRLLASPNFEACTCELAPAVRLNEATVSHHLKKLLDTGLVSKRRNGMNVHYRLNPDAMRALSRVLNIDC